MDIIQTNADSRPPVASAAPRLALGPVGIGIRVVVAIVILFGANFLIGGLSAVLAVIPTLADVMAEQTAASLSIFVLLQVVMLAAVVLAVWAWMRFVERRSIRDAGWRWMGSSVWLLLLAVVIAGGLVVAVVALLPATGPVLDEAELTGSAPVAFSLVALFAQSFLLQAIPEELLFRGWLLSTLRARPWLAITVTTLSFTVIHLFSNGGQESAVERVLYLALPFGFSLLAVGLLLWSGSLWSAVGVHGGFHLGNAAALIFLPEVDAALSWVTIGAVQAVLGLLLIVLALRRGRGILERRGSRAAR
jgi:membrane protease YdiL (CAAX protease family)